MNRASTLPIKPARAWRAARWGGLLGAGVGLLAFAPASWLTAALSAASQERLLFSQAQGTVWRGQARLTLTAGPGSRDRTELPDPLVWQLRPQLSTRQGLGAQVQFSLACCTPTPARLDMGWAWGPWHLTLPALQLQWPAAWLAALGTPLNTLQPAGLVRLSTQQLTWQGKVGAGERASEWQGGAQIDLVDLSSRVSTLDRLGSYRLSLSGQGASGAQLQLQTLDGALRLSGQGQWGGRGLQFRGEASAAPGQEAALDNLVNLIGRRSGARSLISIG